jgi:hypothetical protein
MAAGQPTYDIFSLLGNFIEAAKDIPYLSWFQRIQIALTTGATAMGTWDLTHGDVLYTILASVATFSLHTSAMYQNSPTKNKKLAAADSIATAMQNVEAAGDTAIKKAQTDTPSKTTVDDFIDSMEK